VGCAAYPPTIVPNVSSRGEDRVHVTPAIEPIFRCELTLDGLVRRLVAFPRQQVTRGGDSFRFVEVVQVFDTGRAFRQGQHAARVAGIATFGEWVVTLPEDGRQDPGEIARRVDTAISSVSLCLSSV
jgi:hypothetical protein